jgi:replicative DNA helicase
MDKYEMVANPGTVRKAREKVPGKIWIKDWSHVPTKVSDIRALIYQMRGKGQDVDYLVVDYMELLEPEFFNRAQPRMNYSAICKDLRALGNELDIPQSGAWQAKRLATGKLYLDKDDAGEDWGIIKNADIVIGLNQSSAELRDKTMRLNILKQREGTNRNVMHLYCDLDRMIVREQCATEEKEEVEYGGE